MKLKNRIILSSVLVTLFSVMLTVIAIIVSVAVVGEENAKKQLVEDTKLIASIYENEGVAALARVDDFGVKRVTVVSETGKILFESDVSGSIPSHSNREEIKNAFSGKSEVVKRYSDTLKCNMLYYAVLVENGTARTVLRVAMRTSDISGVAVIALAVSLVTLIIGLIITIIIAGRLSSKVLNRVGKIKDSLKSINDGNYEPIETLATEPEFFGVLNETNEIFLKTNEAIKKLKDEREKTEFVLNSISQGVVALNEKTEIVLINEAAKVMLSAEGSVLNKNLMYLIKDNAVRDAILKNVQGEKLSPCYFSENGKELEITVKTPTTNTVKAIIIINDISVSKLLMRQKSEFFQNASHELKTPLTSVQGLTELLLSKKDIIGESKKYLERIYKESTRLSSLILDMLKLSSLESQQGKPVQLEKCSIAEIANEIVLSLEKKRKEKKIDVKITGDAVINFDAKKLRELMENLYSNALNYNKEKGKVTIKIASGDSPSLKITDTGVGIEKANIPRLCERFYREDKSHSKQTGGTGLGLAIVKYICAIYNARLIIESEKDVGTSVTIMFDGEQK